MSPLARVVIVNCSRVLHADLAAAREPAQQRELAAVNPGKRVA
jgi:hypothetical protein